MFLKAYGKINLALDVLGVREDGYHEVKMVMQTVKLYDGITIEKTNTGKIELQSNLYYLPVDETNIVYKAVKLLFDEFNITSGVKIVMDKAIPVAAGMAGGSADAATVLHGINQLFKLGLSKNELMKRGLKLGADVPYCIFRGTALCEGIGEKITRLPSMPECYILIAKPKTNISTKSIYTELDKKTITHHPDIDSMIEGLKEGNLSKVADNLGNVLELVTVEECPVINDIKKVMMECNALNTLMSGSGPTVFGLFSTEQQAYEAKRRIQEEKLANPVYVTGLFDPVKNKKR